MKPWRLFQYKYFQLQHPKNLINSSLNKSLYIFNNKNYQERQSRDGTVVKQCHKEYRLLSFHFIVIRISLLVPSAHIGLAGTGRREEEREPFLKGECPSGCGGARTCLVFPYLLSPGSLLGTQA